MDNMHEKTTAAEVFRRELVKTTLRELFAEAASMAALGHKELLTEGDVAQMYSYPASTQQKDRMQGIGPSYIKRGKRILYRRRDLDHYFGALRVKTRDQA